MITPQKIQKLSEPIEGIYTACVNELMVNIGKHITSPTWTHTASWEVQKLSEMGQLTQENAAIINKWIKKVTPEMRKTMEFTRLAALKELEKQMTKAAEEGYVTPPVRDSTIQVMNDYADQAVDKLNMVNTVMLQSTLNQYARALNLTEEEVRRKEATQAALNEAAGSVNLGVETRTQAVRRAIRTISAEGLTCFIDRGGHQWSTEAYVNMVVRTTVHNTAIQSVRSRMQDYGTDVFQISSHAGARPLCYPYQGWFCSWSNTSGDIELGDGRVVRYRPLSDTSYGQPAGIFGINCGHYPIPIIAGLTIPHGEDNIQPPEENAKAYAESQEQRALERKIRDAKRTIEMGDDSAEAKAKLKQAQSNMRQFIKDTGRTRRYDRESLYGETKQRSVNNTASAMLNPPFLTQGTAYTTNDLTTTKVKGYAFGDGTGIGVRKYQNATVYETPDGMKFIFPSSYNKAHQTLTVQDLLDAYNQVPQQIRDKGQKEIIVQDVYNPQDAYWRKTYKNFTHSYATGGKEITMWRHDNQHRIPYLVETLAHEMGHYIDHQGNYPTTNTVSSSQQWINAMSGDLAVSGKKSPTSYGENANSEDFAESVAQMALDEKAFSIAFPNRFGILQGML